MCPLYSTCIETSWHALWSCPAAVAVWQNCPRQIQKLSLSKSDGAGLFQQLRDRLEDEDLLLALTMVRLVWLRWNTFVLEGELNHPMYVNKATMEIVDTFKSAQLARVLWGGNSVFFMKLSGSARQWAS
jgi:hypothetical protein